MVANAATSNITFLSHLDPSNKSSIQLYKKKRYSQMSHQSNPNVVNSTQQQQQQPLHHHHHQQQPSQQQQHHHHQQQQPPPQQPNVTSQPSLQSTSHNQSQQLSQNHQQVHNIPSQSPQTNQSQITHVSQQQSPQPSQVVNQQQTTQQHIQSAPQFSFEDPNRSRQNVQSNVQHNAVVFQLPSDYIAQSQDGINDTRTRSLGIGESIQHNTFEGNVPASILPQNITYDGNDIDRRLTNQQVTTNDTILDQNSIARQQSYMSSRPNRLSNEGRPFPNPNQFSHSTIEKRVTCEHCGQLFGDVNSLKRHAVRQHRENTGKDPVYCTHCNAMLKNEQNLRRHIAVCHSGTQEHRCEMCTASFSSRGSLRIHQQNVHNVPSNSRTRGGRGGRGGRGRPGRITGGVNKQAKTDKSYVCDLCPETFKWKGNLKRHRELRHLQLRPFGCPVCQASFGTKSNMRVHMITHSNSAQK